MKIDAEKIKGLCARKRMTLSRLLEEAGVSRNAYYTIARREDILPGSVVAIARTLRVSPATLLKDEEAELRRARRLLKDVDRIVDGNPGIDRDTVRHTLLLLQEKPIERLRRALTRGQHFDFRRR